MRQKYLVNIIYKGIRKKYHCWQLLEFLNCSCKNSGYLQLIPNIGHCPSKRVSRIELAIVIPESSDQIEVHWYDLVLVRYQETENKTKNIQYGFLKGPIMLHELSRIIWRSNKNKQG